MCEWRLGVSNIATEKSPPQLRSKAVFDKWETTHHLLRWHQVGGNREEHFWQSKPVSHHHLYPFSEQNLQIASAWINEVFVQIPPLCSPPPFFCVIRSSLTSPAPQTDIQSWRTTTIYSVRAGPVRDEGCHSYSWSCCCKFLWKYKVWIAQFMSSLKLKVNMIILYKVKGTNPLSILQGGNRSGLSRWADRLLHVHTFSKSEPECGGTGHPLGSREARHPSSGQSNTHCKPYIRDSVINSQIVEHNCYWASALWNIRTSWLWTLEPNDNKLFDLFLLFFPPLSQPYLHSGCWPATPHIRV